LALPILVIDNIPRTDAKADQAAVSVAAAPSTAPTTAGTIPPTTAAPVTEPATTAPPATAPPTTAPRPTKAATVTKVQAPAPTAPPTTSAPATTAPPQPSVAPAGGSEDGQATYYYYRPGECAHKTIPKGTVVTVTNVATGATTSCVVTDRGPYGDGRIIDLDASDFAKIADIGAGVIQVHITW
jgi:rare lipoprotein A (peptidoglycan hydrolase)